MSSQYVLLAALFLSSGAMARAADAALGLFTDQSDVQLAVYGRQPARPTSMRPRVRTRFPAAA